MPHNFTHALLGKTGKCAMRLGLSATYRPGKEAIHRALDEGVNYFFYFGFDTQMVKTLRGVLRSERERYTVATGAYNYIWGAQDIRRTLERRLRQLGTDYIDVFHFLGVMKPEEYTSRVRNDLESLRQDPRVGAIAISTHDRKFAGQLAAEGALDALMIRYNAAHRGAEQDIFPLVTQHSLGVIAYTATRWTYLLRRPPGWSSAGRLPNAGMCYRFVLSHPDVHVCLMAPRNLKQLQENLSALRQGPLSEDDMQFMRDFGDAVHREHKRFL